MSSIRKHYLGEHPKAILLYFFGLGIDITSLSHPFTILQQIIFGIGFIIMILALLIDREYINV